MQATWSRRPRPATSPAPSSTGSGSSAARRGPANAPVTMVVFSDMVCQFCGKALGAMDELLDAYPGKLRIVVKQFPVHASAVLPAEAVYAAEAQGKFWELHDLLMAQPDDPSREQILALGQQAGLDVAALTTALDQHTFAAQVTADTRAGTEIEVTGTPSFLINGKRLTGMLPISEIRAEIDAALVEAAAH